MGKAESKGQVATLTAKLETAYTAIKRLEADLKAAQRRLHTKSLEVVAARKARQEALTLLGMALAEDSSLREKVTALLAEDAEREADIGREAALVAAQMTLTDERHEA
jgi:uncharacterized protein (DUF736 family)